LQFGSFGPRCLLNDADAERACIAVHIPLYHILLFVPIHHSSTLSVFIIWALPFMLTSISLFFCLAVFLIEGFMLSPFSPVCFCRRDTYCRILLLCRIAEFSCLSNLLTTLNYFIPALFHHIFTQPHCISIHSRRSRSFPSSWVSVSLPTQRMYSTSRTTRIIHRSTVSVYPGTFTLPTNR